MVDFYLEINVVFIDERVNIVKLIDFVCVS